MRKYFIVFIQEKELFNKRKEKVIHNRNCNCLLTGQNSGNSFEASLRQKEAQAGARGKAGYPRARHPDRPAHAAGRRAQQDHGGRGCASRPASRLARHPNLFEHKDLIRCVFSEARYVEKKNNAFLLTYQIRQDCYFFEKHNKL